MDDKRPRGAAVSVQYDDCCIKVVAQSICEHEEAMHVLLAYVHVV